jgi:hypothetical protein
VSHDPAQPPVAWDRWWLRAGDYLVEIRGDHKGLRPNLWEKLEAQYRIIPTGVWDAMAEGDRVAGQSIEEAAGSWQQTAQEQRDSGQPLVPPAASAGQAPT